jgi:RNA polymerase sigma factor (sigma-70 family)
VTSGVQSEDGLIAAAQAGDRAAIEALLERYQERVFGFGLRMCGDSEDAKDVLQDTLLAAARTVGKFRGDSSVSTWLYTIARSFCIKKRRRSKFAPAEERSLDRDLITLPSSMPGPDELAARGEVKRGLATALEALESLLARDPDLARYRGIDRPGGRRGHRGERRSYQEPPASCPRGRSRAPGGSARRGSAASGGRVPRRDCRLLESTGGRPGPTALRGVPGAHRRMCRLPGDVRLPEANLGGLRERDRRFRSRRRQRRGASRPPGCTAVAPRDGNASLTTGVATASAECSYRPAPCRSPKRTRTLCRLLSEQRRFHRAGGKSSRSLAGTGVAPLNRVAEAQPL